MTERFLSGVEPYKQLSAPARKRLAGLAGERSYLRGETIFHAGEPSDAVWVVKAGRVHLMKFLANGKASTTCVMTPGETFCCLPALDRKTYPTDAIAAQDSVVIRIPSEAFHHAMARSPAFTHQTLCLFCDRLRQVEQKSCTVYDSAEARFAQVLLTLSKKFGATIPLTRQELAEIAGTTPETAIRTLSGFAKQGVVRSSRGRITILSPQRLSVLCSTS